MTTDLSSKLAAARETLARLPAEKWEHIEKGRIFLAEGNMIALVHEQIPDDVDPDGDDPKAWEIGDAAVEEAGRRAEAVALLVNARGALLDVAEALQTAVAYMENGDFSNGVDEYGRDEGRTLWIKDVETVHAALARLAEAL
jgi:hypothetical protein